MAKDTPKPKFREYPFGSLVNLLEGKERNKPEVCYIFSNGVKKVETDRTSAGIYEK